MQQVKGNGCKLSKSRELPSPIHKLASMLDCPHPESLITNHFKIVELFLDLLGKKRSQPVARCNFAPAIIFATGPCIMELDARAENKVPRSHG